MSFLRSSKPIYAKFQTLVIKNFKSDQWGNEAGLQERGLNIIFITEKYEKDTKLAL